EQIVPTEAFSDSSLHPASELECDGAVQNVYIAIGGDHGAVIAGIDVGGADGEVPLKQEMVLIANSQLQRVSQDPQLLEIHRKTQSGNDLFVIEIVHIQ